MATFDPDDEPEIPDDISGLFPPDDPDSPAAGGSGDRPYRRSGAEPAGDFPRGDFPGGDFPSDAFASSAFPSDAPSGDFPRGDFPADDFPADDFPADEFPADEFPADDFLGPIAGADGRGGGRPDDAPRGGLDDGRFDGGSVVPPSDLDDVVAVLDNPDLVHARDPGRLLWALATAGAQVRRSIALAAERNAGADSGGDALSDQPPRAVLVVTDASASVAGPVLAHLGGGHAAVLDWRAAELPRWAGPADVLLAASVDGLHPRVATLVAEADRRGLTVVAVSPEDSPVAAAAGRGLRIGIEPPDHRRAALWTMLTPLLLAARDLGVVSIDDGELAEVAAGLDAVAEACRPNTDAFANAAKQLAVEISESDPLVVGCGPLSALAARWMTDSLALMAGIAGLALALPDDLAEAGALLEIVPSGPALDASADEFFRDRTEPTLRRRRLLILPEYGVSSPVPGRPDYDRPRPAPASDGLELHDIAAARSAGALDDIASARGIVSSRPELPGVTPLVRFAAATAFGDFTAAYAAIGRGVDPGATRAGELPF